MEGFEFYTLGLVGSIPTWATMLIPLDFAKKYQDVLDVLALGFVEGDYAAMVELAYTLGLGSSE